MDIRKLQRAIVDGLEDVKGQNIVVFNTEKLSPLFERVIIASGTSNRQTKALAGSVRETVKKRGMAVMATEGEDNGEWIIVDCGAAVAHIMQPAIRDYYHLEEIWGGKAVKLKTAEVKGLPKAEEPATRPAAKSAAGKTSKRAPAARESRMPPSRVAPAPSPRAAVAKKASSASKAPSAKKAPPARKALSTAKAPTGKRPATPGSRTAPRPAAKAPGKTAGRPAGKPAGKATSRKSAAARKTARA